MTVDTVPGVPNFEPFRRSTPRPEGATVTLTRAGALNLSSAAVALIGTPAHVRLFWDREARILGIRPAQDSDADALRLSITRGQGVRTVAAKAFAKWAGIELSRARRWAAYLDDDGVLCADLGEPGAEVSSNRARDDTDPD